MHVIVVLNPTPNKPSGEKWYIRNTEVRGCVSLLFLVLKLPGVCLMQQCKLSSQSLDTCACAYISDLTVLHRITSEGIIPALCIGRRACDPSF